MSTRGTRESWGILKAGVSIGFFLAAGPLWALTPNLAELTENRDITVSAAEGLGVIQNVRNYDISLRQGYGSVKRGKEYYLSLSGKPNYPGVLTELYTSPTTGVTQLEVFDLESASRMRSYTSCNVRSKGAGSPAQGFASPNDASVICNTVNPAVCKKFMDAAPGHDWKKFFEQIDSCYAIMDQGQELLKLQGENPLSSEEKKRVLGEAQKSLKDLYEVEPRIAFSSDTQKAKKLEKGKEGVYGLTRILKMCEKSYTFWKPAEATPGGTGASAAPATVPAPGSGGAGEESRTAR